MQKQKLERLDLKEVAKAIRELVSRKNSLEDFEECGLLNMCMIAVYEMTDKNKIEYPHYYTVTRSINEVLGRNTAKMRGREEKDANGSVIKEVIENEGVKQSQIEKTFNSNTPSIFIKGKSPAWVQELNLPKESGRFLRGWRINHKSTVSFLGTAYLFKKLSERINEFGLSPDEVQSVLDNTAEDFCGELDDKTLEKEKKTFKAKLNSLVRQKYLKYDADGYLVIRELIIKPESTNRNSQSNSDINITKKEIEACYLNYLFQKSLRELKSNREVISNDSNLLSKGSKGGKLR